jgi:hypothetical protein
MNRSISQVSFILVLWLASCANHDPASVPLAPVSVSNFAADPPTIFPANGIPAGYKNKFSFFSFRTGTRVSSADSASTKWDIAFRRTTIIVNGGPQRLGKGGAIIVDGVFAELTAAFTSGYDVDSLVTINGANKATYAIPTDQGIGWFTDSNQLITPTAGKFLLIRTADEKYAKVEILNYYKDASSPPSATSVPGYYTFRYIYQPNGTVNF